MKTYISGPMTGYEHYNYPFFERVARRLREKGWDIVSPHEIPAPRQELEEEAMWEYYMAACKKQVESCDRIVMLEGWPESKGARQELAWAIEQGKPVYFYSEFTGKIVLMSRITVPGGPDERE